MSTDSRKDDLISSLLEPKGLSSKHKIEVIGEEETNSDILNKVDEEPSMLELMMAAQSSAKKAKGQEEAVAAQKETKTFANGFKKGFFGSKPSSTTTNSSSSQNKTLTTANTNTVDVKSQTNKSLDESIPTIKKLTKDSSLVLDEVQNSLKEDENPMLKQLKTGGSLIFIPNIWYVFIKSYFLYCSLDWVTPELSAKFQTNKIVSDGLKNPKCMAAMQLMQKSPEEAKKKYANDTEVDIFLREFGKLMSDHFYNLAEQQNPGSTSNQSKTVNNLSKPVQEVGVLQSEALKRQK